MFGTVKVRTTKPRRAASRWSTATYWISAVFVGMIMLGLVFVMLPASWFSGSSTTPVPLPSESAIPAADVTCAEQAPVTDSSGLLVPTWVLIGSTPTPQSATGGPVLDRTPRQCFTRSDEGAVYAAASVLSELTAVTETSLRRQILNERVSHTGAFQKMLATAARTSNNGPTTASPVWAQYIGYRITSSTPDLVQLDIAVRSLSGSDTGVVNAISFTMIWERNDWLLIAPDEAGLPTQELTSFTGFTPWGQAS